MLRTRRRDNNVKPNRRDSSFKSRLDRKSSRGMLYENEELRLKTININAEIERGQSDIKKLKRENEMLKKEIWCLRDEYEKLDKLLKDKKLDFSSSSTTYSSSSSDSESCSSCTEESEEVETSQNLKNVQKTNLKNIRNQFDHLSIVTEETSCENSDRNSSVNTRLSHGTDQNDMLWNYNDKDAIKPDQSYPVYDTVLPNKSQTLPNQMPMNYFAPIQHSKSFDDNHFHQFQQAPLYPEDFYTPPLSNNNPNESQTPPIAISPSASPLYENQQVVFAEHGNDTEQNFLSKKIVETNANNFYQNMILVPKNTNPQPTVQSMEKKATDLIVKIDNQNFNKNLTYSNTTPSTTFSNGGNLEELLYDIESISQDILKLTNLQRGFPGNLSTIQEPPEHVPNQDFFNAEQMGQFSPHAHEQMTNQSGSQERLHKSELNVVLMPKAMPLIGFDKYKNIQRSFESLNSKHLEAMSASQQNLCLIPPPPTEEAPSRSSSRPNLHVSLKPPQPSQPPFIENNPNNNSKVDTSLPSSGKDGNQEHNPFFFGNLNDNYVNADYFSRRYNPENFIEKGENTLEKKEEKNATTSNEPPVENDETTTLKASKGINDSKQDKLDKKEEKSKSPKMSITKKVSIHFKGKKEREKLKKLTIVSNTDSKSSSAKSVQDGKKSSLFDFKLTPEVPKDKPDQKELSSPKLKDKALKHIHQKTPSIESKKSTTETSNFEPKTPNSSESDRKNLDKKDAKKEDRKSRKSVSVSPDRIKHVQLLHDGVGIRKHKKHRRDRSGGIRGRRGSVLDPRLRERSFSICTDRSMVGPGLAYGSFLYEDYSDRERTNSASSCDSNENPRKMSGISNVPFNGKVPWCGCWGNGCL
ncbi:homeobox protein 4 isoform X3 [Anthonomus grandis grandis]|uniref:homeobox protein 4 isoform X3 n=1 Tax=Anthonomus grandis grandis TaxID=2921223 RepID=UPI00216687CE|nr:homeobox protein 4 isoform X3 [Anthonomus grandis grandis]